MKREISYREECDLKAIFVTNWIYVSEAYTRGLPTGHFTREQVNSIEALRDAGLLDGMKLDTKWRRAIDEVSSGRSIHALSDDDKKLIVEAWVRLEFWGQPLATE
ncbi:hypothetical protein IC762_01330 [Bradyrhizobium genosp. L]|uniref:hypothetical protein n=1 Tax=Bradyrhizobium genosp. L TaxID=83637 RepID=UPI0018A26E9A|nr:hypothetical protein [Bradyrhizobium genosp. L]QPF85009.1 hypothetical protein IC762_01330 [Bradyrhizobium genosp. L]